MKRFFRVVSQTEPIAVRSQRAEEARNMLAVWKSRKYVLQITDNSYQKVTRD